MEHKFVELLSMKFVESSDLFVRRQITYRYNNMKSKLNIMHAKLADVNALVSIHAKDPERVTVFKAPFKVSSLDYIRQL